MASVTILCPNGRRQAIKVAPNKTILQILEEVCQKRGYDPATHDLKHGRNTLDIGTAFRFSGVPNNGKLELVERETARSLLSEITIALSLESGERRQKTLTTDTTLADMVRAFQETGEDLLKDEGEIQPVVINMRDEVIGMEALEESTLQSIGLVSGRVALRLVHRSVPKGVLEEISNKLKVKKQKLEKLNAELATRQQEMVKPAKQTEKPTISAGATSNVESSQSPRVSSESLPIQASRVETPMEETDVKVDSEVKQANIDTQRASNEARVHASPHTADTQTQAVLRLVKPKPAPVPVQPVMEFKFPEETAGKDIYKNELSDVKPSEYLPCDRDPVVFSLKESTEYLPTTTSEDIPDDFFEVTKSDLQRMIRDLREQIIKEEDSPLITSSMRQARLMSSFDKYQYAVIRFHFPDQMVLQARFRPRETVHSLNKFLQQHLKDKHQQFYLYVTPPKKLLDDPAMTLILAQLVPMAIVYVSSSDGTDCCLSDEMLALKTSRLEADKLTKSSLPPPTERVSDATNGRADDASVAGPSSAQPIRTNPPAVATSDKIVPKWYRPSGK